VENLAPTGIRSPDHPARSKLLYRLSYSIHQFLFKIKDEVLVNPEIFNKYMRIKVKYLQLKWTICNLLFFIDCIFEFISCQLCFCFLYGSIISSHIYCSCDVLRYTVCHVLRFTCSLYCTVHILSITSSQHSTNKKHNTVTDNITLNIPTCFSPQGINISQTNTIQH
jgi:hypothetical protein